jgi:hypothetical protein
MTQVLALLAFASSALAADPIVGTWSLNIPQSKFSPVLAALTQQQPPKERTETYREIEGDQIEFSTREIRADGSSVSGKMFWPARGGAVRVESGGVPGFSYVEAFLSPGEWLVIALQDGRQVGSRHKLVSKDGKTMKQTVTGVAPDGKPIEQIEVYERR